MRKGASILLGTVGSSGLATKHLPIPLQLVEVGMPYYRSPCDLYWSHQKETASWLLGDCEGSDPAQASFDVTPAKRRRIFRYCQEKVSRSSPHSLSWYFWGRGSATLWQRWKPQPLTWSSLTPSAGALGCLITPCPGGSLDSPLDHCWHRCWWGDSSSGGVWLE